MSLRKLFLLAFLLGAVIAAPIALWVGYALWYHAEPQVQLAPAPGYTQPDGSLVPPRMPVAELPDPPHDIPRGSREIRRVHATLTPAERPVPEVPGSSCSATCPPLALDMSLVEDEHGSRVVLSSPDGRFSDGRDQVLVTTTPPVPRTWLQLQLAEEHALGVQVTHRFQWFGKPVTAGIGTMYLPDHGPVATATLGLPLNL